MKKILTAVLAALFVASVGLYVINRSLVKTPVNNQPQPKLVATMQLPVLRQAKPPVVVPAVVDFTSEDSPLSEPAVVATTTNDVPKGYKRIKFTLVGGGFAVKQTNHVGQ